MKFFLKLSGVDAFLKVPLSKLSVEMNTRKKKREPKELPVRFDVLWTASDLIRLNLKLLNFDLISAEVLESSTTHNSTRSSHLVTLCLASMHASYKMNISGVYFSQQLQEGNSQLTYGRQPICDPTPPHDPVEKAVTTVVVSVIRRAQLATCWL